MKNYACLHLEKLKADNSRDIRIRYSHVMRLKYAENVNKEKSYLDRVILDNGKTWLQTIEAKKKELGYREREAKKGVKKDNDKKILRRDAVVGLEFIAQMSHDAAEHIDIDRWCDKNLKWFRDRYGEDNVHSVVLHLDENTPHLHVFVTPVKDNRFLAKEIVGGKNELAQMHTDYAAAMEEFNLIRGLNRRNRKRSTSLDIHNLYQERESYEVPVQGSDEPDREYISRLQQEAKELSDRAIWGKQQVAQMDEIREYAHYLESENRTLTEQVRNHLAAEKEAKALEYALKNIPDKKLGDEFSQAYSALIAFGTKELAKAEEEREVNKNERTTDNEL